MSKLKILLVILLLITFGILYLMFFHPSSIKGSKNFEHSKNIYRGMSLDSMMMIMGKPDKILNDNFSTYQSDSGKLYYYDLGFAAADGINIIVDTTERVRAVISE
ncbi:MAG: hypothetical protein H7329_04360 [Opitutaceae bacterium]|nr:hypothetical protein [Cytophagales bacterium]